MKITVEMEISEETARYISNNSIERVINTAIRMAEAVATRKIPASTAEDAEMSIEDLSDCKMIATQIWNDTRNAILLKLFGGE